MLSGISQDWPLSREEKKQRLLNLYDKDLKQTDHLLQMSSRQNVPSSARGTSLLNKESVHVASDSKENIADNFNTSPASALKIPGIIDDGADAECASPLAETVAPRCSVLTPPPSKDYHSLSRGPPVPPPPAAVVIRPPPPAIVRPWGVDNDLIGELPLAADDPQFQAQFKVPPPVLEDTKSSQGSGRSCEYLTPDATPRASLLASYCGSLGLPALPAHLPISAPTGEPRSTAGKDFSVCQRTGTVIPAIPPMPSATLRRAGQGDSPEVPVTAALSSRSQGSRAQSATGRSCRSQASPSSQASSRRSYSAAAENAFSVYRSSSKDAPHRRRSEASLKELCHPPHIFSAARHGRFAEVEDALCAGFSADYADSYGNTIFHIACQNGKKRVAKLVIKYGGNLNVQNLKGNTGLHFLFAYGYPDIAEYFITKGADEHIQNELGNEAREGIR